MSKSEYSDKEALLISSFGYYSLLKEESISPPTLYAMCAERAFIEGMEGPCVEALRRAMRALQNCTCHRQTLEWDRLITFGEEE
jgi:hypothetical protein